MSVRSPFERKKSGTLILRGHELRVNKFAQLSMLPGSGFRAPASRPALRPTIKSMSFCLFIVRAGLSEYVKRGGDYAATGRVSRLRSLTRKAPVNRVAFRRRLRTGLWGRIGPRRFTKYIQSGGRNDPVCSNHPRGTCASKQDPPAAHAAHRSRPSLPQVHIVLDAMRRAMGKFRLISLQIRVANSRRLARLATIIKECIPFKFNDLARPARKSAHYSVKKQRVSTVVLNLQLCAGLEDHQCGIFLAVSAAQTLCQAMLLTGLLTEVGYGEATFEQVQDAEKVISEAFDRSGARSCSTI
jgi:hypothetical protein